MNRSDLILLNVLNSHFQLRRVDAGAQIMNSKQSGLLYQ